MARRRSDTAELAETPLARLAHAAGPWEVEQVERAQAGDGCWYVVTRRDEPAREGGGARMSFVRRQEVLLGAAALSAFGVADRLTVNLEKCNGRRRSLRHPVHDGGAHVGHLSPLLVSDLAAASPKGARPGDPWLGYFHACRALAVSPRAAAAALWVESLDFESLNLLGRAIMRRLSREV